MIAVLCVIAATLIVVVVLLAKAQHKTSPSVSDYVRQRVVVHTKRPDDQSIRGVFETDGDDCVVITSPEWLEAAQADPAPGRVVVLKRDISSIQILEG